MSQPFDDSEKKAIVDPSDGNKIGARMKNQESVIVKGLDHSNKTANMTGKAPVSASVLSGNHEEAALDRLTDNASNLVVKEEGMATTEEELAKESDLAEGEEEDEVAPLPTENTFGSLSEESFESRHKAHRANQQVFEFVVDSDEEEADEQFSQRTENAYHVFGH